MAIVPFPLQAKFGKPTRWLLSMSIQDVAKALNGEPTHLTLMLPFALDEQMEFWTDTHPMLLVCAQREVLVSTNEQSDPLCLSGDPDCGAFGGCVIPSKTRVVLDGASVHPAHILCFSREPMEDISPDQGSLFRQTFDLRAIATELGGPLSWVYVNSIERNGLPAGNHWHKHKSERFFALTGSLRIGLVDLETKLLTEHILHEMDGPEAQPLYIRPETAHAVQNIAHETSRLLVFATGEPRDNDDNDFDVYPSPF